jgi:hypothetical protein
MNFEADDYDFCNDFCNAFLDEFWLDFLSIFLAGSNNNDRSWFMNIIFFGVYIDALNILCVDKVFLKYLYL